MACGRRTARRLARRRKLFPASGNEPYFGLALECRLSADSGPFRRDLWRPAIRPIEASKAAIRNGCFTVHSRHSIAGDEAHNPPQPLRSLYRLALVCGIMIPQRQGRVAALSACQSAEATQTAASSSMNS